MIVINITVLLGYMVLLTGFLEFQGRFLYRPYNPYVLVWEFIGVRAVIYGSIVGLLTYGSSRLWGNGRSHLRIVSSALLLIICLTLLAIGLAFVFLMCFLLTGEW